MCVVCVSLRSVVQQLVHYHHSPPGNQTCGYVSGVCVCEVCVCEVCVNCVCMCEVYV